MNKLIKIIILILLLISVGLSVLIYFDFLPFFKKTVQEEPKIPTQVTSEITPETTELPVSRMPFPCIILDDEYCPQGELVYDGEQLVGLGFKLPEGSKIYAPFKGELEVNVLHEINGQFYPAQ